MVKPNNKQERVEKTGKNSFSIWVKAKPQNGKANQAAINILAEYLNVTKSAVTLLKGKTSRQKIFKLRLQSFLKQDYSD